MKKWFSIVLALVLVVAMVMAFATVSSAAFTDAASITKTEAVDVLSTLGVIKGYEDGSFKPEGTVTRAEMAKMIKKYPNADINDFGVVCKITEDDFNAFYKGEIESNDNTVLRYSEDMVANPTSEAIRETITYISDSIRTGDAYAQKIMNKFTSLNIDPYNLNQLATDKELSLNIIYDYIDNEGSFIMDSINHFPCEDGIERRIDSNEVIQYVMKNKTAEALFLKTILSAATSNSTSRLPRRRLKKWHSPSTSAFPAGVKRLPSPLMVSLGRRLPQAPS